MPTIPLEFPVLVTASKEGYHLRPLFIKEPHCTAKRFSKAVDLMIKEVQRLFRSFEMERCTSNDLLWFAFNPKITFMLSGPIASVRFALKGHLIICFPKFDHFFAILDKKKSIHIQVSRIISNCICKERKKDPGNFSIEDYDSNKHEFVTTISLSVTIKQASFPFETEMEEWFASLNSQQETFSGAIELARVATNWKDAYPDKLQRAILRDEVVERLEPLILGETKTAIVIIGTPGCGRTTVLQEAYFRYLKRCEDLKKRKVHKPITTIWHVDPNRVIAGMSIVGQWQRRFESILEHVIQSPSQPRLFFDNLVALFRVGKSAQNTLTLSDVLKPYLEQRSLTFIAEASPAEWNIVIETDRRFADLCHVFRLEESNMLDTARIAIKKRAFLEHKYECQIDHAALERIFSLRHSVLQSTAMPGNVINFLERLSAKHHLAKIGISQVETAVNEISRMSSDILTRAKVLSYKSIQSALSQQLIGQDEAIECLVALIQTIKAGLADPKKPLASLLFIGPTGVGKTQAAKVLNQYLFTDASQLIRLDMNEFVTDADVGRLIGSWGRPDGLLTTKIRHQPFSIVLLDEIEKAHPAIHDLLLQVLGEGRLTDVLGRTTDFTHTIIILTSNLGAEHAKRRLGFVERDAQNQATSYRAAVEDFFRPELLNRIDRMVVFNSLRVEDAIAISRIQLESLLQRDGFVRRNTVLNISEDALKTVARKGFDDLLGGRALKRAIERDLTVLAATQLVTLSDRQAILLDIDWHQDHLHPHITALTPLKTDKALNSHLRQHTQTLERVTQLLEHTIALRRRFYHLQDTQELLEHDALTDENNLILHMQDAVFDIKESLDETLWAMEIARDPTEMRFAASTQQLNFSWSQSRPFDHYPHQEIRDYLEELYILTPKLIRDAQSQWVYLIIKTAFLEFFCEGFELKQQKQCTLILTSRIQGSGDTELEYLLSAYEKTLAYIGLYTTHKTPAPGIRHLYIKGPRIHTLLKTEEGLHLFHPSNENVIPIQVSLTQPTVQNTLNIIRHYALPTEHGRKTGVIKDLRTGMLNRSGLKAYEWAMLWYANIIS